LTERVVVGVATAVNWHLNEELPWVAGLLVAVVVIAALVNRVRPQHKRRLRRLLVTYALYAIGIGVTAVFFEIDRPTWGSTTAVAAQLLQAYVLVMLGATLVFTVLLPALTGGLPLIASDLIVGLGVVAATLVILSRNGMDATNAVVSGAVVSAVLAISLQSTLGNILGGIALQLDGSIHEGDWIQFDNARVGRVRAVRWRHTVVETRDCSTIIVPNAQLLAQSITILGKRDGAPMPQRLGVMFNVDYRFAPSHVTRIVTEALLAAPIENVADTPKPACVCVDLAKESREAFAQYRAAYSIVDLAQEDGTASRIRARIYAALKRENIALSMPALIAFAETPPEIDQKRAQRENVDRIAALRSVPLFHTFADDELQTLAHGLRRSVFTEGERVFRQGGVARSLYILVTGRCEVRTNIDPDGAGGDPERPIYVASIQAPDFFGERGLMTGDPRSADVIALSDVECFRLDKDTFQKVLLARPAIATEVSEKLATRRMELIAARDGVAPSKLHHESETERIKRAIQGFFGL
jgi:CRP-like cAMP-binding protein/small-conductance mechanosensitive channel